MEFAVRRNCQFLHAHRHSCASVCCSVKPSSLKRRRIFWSRSFGVLDTAHNTEIMHWTRKCVLICTFASELPRISCWSKCLNALCNCKLFSCWYYLLLWVHTSPFQSLVMSAKANFWHTSNPLNAELNPICYLLALLGAHHFLHVSRIRVKSLTLRQLMSYIYGAPILDVSRSHTTTHHSR